MKKAKLLLTAICLFFLWNCSSGQGIYTPVTPTIFGQNFNRIQPFLVQHLPEKSGLQLNTTLPVSQIFYNTIDGFIYGWSSTRGYFQLLDGSYTPSVVNIYNSDGTLSGNRLLGGANHTFTLNNSTAILLQSVDNGSLSITKDIQLVTGSGGNMFINGLGSSTTTPDLLTFDHSSNKVGYLTIGTSGKVLTSNGTTASWQTPAAGGITGIATANGFAGSGSPTVTLSTTITGMLKGNGTSISAATSGTDYVIPSGTVANFSGSLVGDVTGTQGATVVGKINGTSLAGLATGILKNTTTTGVPSIAIAADFPTLNQNTTGTSANVTGTVAVANGGTGRTSTTIGGLLVGSSTSAYGNLAIGTSGYVLSSNGTTATWATPGSLGWTATGSDLYNTAGGKIGIGNTAPAVNLDVTGTNFTNTVNVNGNVTCNNGTFNSSNGFLSSSHLFLFAGSGGGWFGNVNGNAGTGSTFLQVTSSGAMALNGNTGAAPAASAQLDITSTTKGFLAPRMTTTQVNAIASPAEGLITYDNTLHLPKYYNGTAWNQAWTSLGDNTTTGKLIVGGNTAIVNGTAPLFDLNSQSGVLVSNLNSRYTLIGGNPSVSFLRVRKDGQYDMTFSIDTAGAYFTALNAMVINNSLFVAGSLKSGATFIAGGLASTSIGSSSIPSGGLSLRAPNGTSSFINFTENGAAFNWAVGDAGGGNGDLIFKTSPSDGESFTGTERFRLTKSTGDLLIGTATDVTTSKFTISSTTQGSIPHPSMTTTQTNAITSPATGLHVYDNTLNFDKVYDGSAWWQTMLGLSGSVSSAVTAATTVTVTIPTTMPNNTYKVSITPTSALAMGYYVTNKTTTTFDVTYASPITGTDTFDWTVIK